jgi:hypothetical protein
MPLKLRGTRRHLQQRARRHGYSLREGRREAAGRDQAADWISPVNAARTASSRSVSVKPRCSCSRATTRSRKTPRFSTVTRSAAAQTARSCESVKASMQSWSCRRDGCQPAIAHHRPLGTEKASGVTSEPHDAGLRSELFAHKGAAAPKAGGLLFPQNAAAKSLEGMTHDDAVIVPAHYSGQLQ